jgi:hypothetical protein
MSTKDLIKKLENDLFKCYQQHHRNKTVALYSDDEDSDASCISIGSAHDNNEAPNGVIEDISEGYTSRTNIGTDDNNNDSNDNDIGSNDNHTRPVGHALWPQCPAVEPRRAAPAALYSRGHASPALRSGNHELLSKRERLGTLKTPRECEQRRISRSR